MINTRNLRAKLNEMSHAIDHFEDALKYVDASQCATRIKLDKLERLEEAINSTDLAHTANIHGKWSDTYKQEIETLLRYLEVKFP